MSFETIGFDRKRANFVSFERAGSSLFRSGVGKWKGIGKDERTDFIEKMGPLHSLGR